MERRFGWVLTGQSRGPDLICDVDLAAHSDAAVVPTIGSILPGWLLVIPRREALSFAQLGVSERSKLLNLARDASKEVASFGKQVYFLEHGAARSNSTIGCGVDQAHLHVVPADFDLQERVLADPEINWTAVNSADPWELIPEGTEYYYISSQNGCFVGFPQTPQKQYFRRQIAQAIGVPEVWDYREWPFYERAKRTIDHFSCASGVRRAA